MAVQWIEKITGSFEQKQRWREHRARLDGLPQPYRAAHDAVERYLLHSGAVSDGQVLLTMLRDLGDLFEQSAADRVPIRDVVSDDPVEFADAFLQNYADGRWTQREGARLTGAIDRAAEDRPR